MAQDGEIAVKFDKYIRRVVPSLSRLTYNRMFQILVDSVDRPARRLYREFRTLPPNHLRIRVGVRNRLMTNQVAFISGAPQFWIYAIDAGLVRLSGSTIVDIGCGCGRFARVLRDQQFSGSRFDGKYIGIDIDDEMLSWCQEHFDAERFEFFKSGHRSAAYAAGGGAGRSSIPLGSSEADFVFAMSLFTHLLEEEVAEYVYESARVLRPGGHMAVTFFSMDHPPPTLGTRHTFRHRLGAAYIESVRVPEAAVAYRDEYLCTLARDAGFSSATVKIGRDAWQAVLLCRR
jgi:SAM-dependent methyltransferase